MSEVLPNWLLKRAQLSPNRIAIAFENGATLTFQELHESAMDMAEKLSSLGVNRGDHVGVLIENTPEAVTLIHGLEYIGAVMVLLNTRLTMNELEWQLKDAHVKLFIYDDVFSHTAKQCNLNCDVIKISLQSVTVAQEMAEVELVEQFSLDQCHTIIYTSGTTGLPKGVQLTYGNHWWSAIGSNLNLGHETKDKWLCCLPIFHVSGLSILMRSVIYGITVCLHRSFDPKKVNNAIINQQVTIISAVSVMLQRMIDQLHATNSELPPSFRCVLLGGGPAPLSLLERAKGYGIPVYQTYGMTETASQIVTLSPEYMIEKLGSAGKPLFPAMLKIVNDNKESDPGMVGEIIVKGANVTKGYFNRPEATKDLIQDGWLHTGDLGFTDEEGFLFVVDRRSDLIISGGENIYPAEIEDVLLSHPSIAEAGVTGQADAMWGKVPIAFVVCKGEEQLTEDELIGYCKEKLAKYKVPKSILFVKELPRNAAKKLLRRKLLELLPK